MLEFISDLFFPKKCVGCRKIGSYLCDNCFANIDLYTDYICPMCLRRSITGETHPGCIKPYSLDGIFCGVVYKGVVKRLIYRFKYKPFISDLASIIGKIFIETITQNEIFMKVLYSRPIVVEVPLFEARLRKRGYNQTELLGRILANEFELNFQPKILKRIKNTNPQFKLNKKQREENIHEAFVIDQKFKKLIYNKAVFLLDDLATSCTTLRECSKVLKRNGARYVYGVTFAREI